MVWVDALDAFKTLVEDESGKTVSRLMVQYEIWPDVAELIAVVDGGDVYSCLFGEFSGLSKMKKIPGGKNEHQNPQR